MASPRSWISMAEALPGLCTARDAGRLVPFLGSGISHPYCRSWKGFIKALADQLGDGPSTSSAIEAAPANPEVLYRIADRLAAWLRLRPLAERRTILIEALRDPLKAEFGLPAQAVALARHYWPLIITSNYDDVVPVTMRRRFGDVSIRIRGRSPQDCTEVVRMLDVLQTPIVWYIQGHIAGIADESMGIGNPALDLLVDEMVVGHQQYQRAINSDTAFRRAFSEVFRRRSVLFIGSGLSESYFVNLIAEALFSLGPSAAPHYALFTADELEKTDPEFLTVRLGITPVVYGERHEELPAGTREDRGSQASRHKTIYTSSLSIFLLYSSV